MKIFFFSLKKFCNNRHNFYTIFMMHFVVLYTNVCLKNENSASIITGEVLIHERAFCAILYTKFRSSHCNSCFKVLQKNASEVCPHCKEVSQRHKKTKRVGHHHWCHSGPENFKKFRQKKLVKSNKPISRKKFFDQILFLAISKMAKNQFLNWKKL